MVSAAKIGVHRRSICADIVVEALYGFVGWNARNLGWCGFGETVNERVDGSHGGLGGRYWWDAVLRSLL